MNNKHYVGGAVSRFQDLGILPLVSQVKLFVDDDTYFVAPTKGDDSGYTIEAFCPSATQAIADSILAQLQSCRYQGYKASSATISPDAELGDGVDIRGVYGMIARQDLHFGATHTADLEAPSEDLYNKKYPFVSETRKNLSRNDRKVSTLIQQSSEQIRLEVFGEDGYTGSSIAAQLDSISQQVRGKVDGATVDNKIAVALDSITISSSTSGVSGNNSCSITLRGKSGDIDITATGIITLGNVVADSVSASNIRGSLTSDQIDLYGELTVYRDSDLDRAGGYMGYTTSTKDGSAGMHMESRYGSGEVRVTENGVAMEHDDGGSVVCTNNASINGDYVFVDSYWETYVFSSAFYSENAAYLGLYGNEWEALYANTGTIQISDERKKTDIVRDVSKYRAFLLDLLPSCGKYINGTSNRTHIFFVAQDVEQMMAKHGLTDLDFAGLIKSPIRDKLTGEVIDYMYALRYAEFIPLILDAVQWQHSRMQNQENRLDDQEKRLQAVEQALGLR